MNRNNNVEYDRTVMKPRLSGTAKPIINVPIEQILEFVGAECRRSLSDNIEELHDVTSALTILALCEQPVFRKKLKEYSIDGERYYKVIELFTILSLPLLRFEMQQPPDQELCKQILEYALSLGQRMLETNDHTFIEVWKLLVFSGLEPFTYRFNQFLQVVEDNKNNHRKLIEQGIIVIETVLE